MAYSNSFFTQAQECNKLAVSAENAKDYRLAFEHYKRGCQALRIAFKYENNYELKEKIKEILTDMLKRAEDIHRALPQLEKAKEEPPTTDEQKYKPKGSGDDDDEGLKDALEGAILREKSNVKWNDVAGLEQAKQSLKEAVVLPIKFPDLFDEKRRPWKGILLYGPPGTGKSYLAKAVATEADATFFSVSSSDLMSKWVGQSERFANSLLELARENKPSIVFVDEIDSIAGKRGDAESETARKVMRELLVQMQGFDIQNDGIMLLGATNKPWDLDSAVLRKFEKKILIPLPEASAREEMFRIHLGNTTNTLTDKDFRYLSEKSEGYSGQDIHIVVRDALMQPIRRLESITHFKKYRVRDADGTTTEKWVGVSPAEPGAVAMNFMSIPSKELCAPPVTLEDMLSSLMQIRPSVKPIDAERCERWAKEFGIQR
ncbi:Vacuolar protein sorting 4F (Vps4F) [Monocercomonoides exilis]|uniref:Vacuolar protein sorting 4F (Vps4F) n=1 Tax=Monocercomonoides exilis TaxID=2049356 RepID=UPI0035594912|nr:Vacuolar protein sorting 4F (Vps4F) [Monocercomonoides exilis]|eukprot:MONOS_12922.1-p1 / transcript=MONOS_12922.1 / gene=MONOS_12922 / organism=Monocercomonoides_exilis_PA203 / gene_product= Vacuolar protein sorting 4F (Vps4F) / transcript_product= Vacuolar protein sorting 4F (Vps4F) / location=Mono_scaffold00753:13042-14865(+) / protein_length=431 / sequence_SO=supercontig / SO=protein_coding / is_pseudo=false